jgi:hypothetical protein
VVGFAHRFRPTYAGANMGHPYRVVETDADLRWRPAVSQPTYACANMGHPYRVVETDADLRGRPAVSQPTYAGANMGHPYRGAETGADLRGRPAVSQPTYAGANMGHPYGVVETEASMRGDLLYHSPRMLVRTWDTLQSRGGRSGLDGDTCGIPHLAKNERDVGRIPREEQMPCPR